MTIAKITGQGLTSIAILVALLWACIVDERLLAHRARAGMADTLEAMRTLRLKNRHEPVAAPAAPVHRRARAVVG